MTKTNGVRDAALSATDPSLPNLWPTKAFAPAAPVGVSFVWNDALDGNFVGTGWLANGAAGVPGADDTADMSVTGAAYTVLVDNLSITSDGGTQTFTDYTLGSLILGVDATLEIDPNSFDLQYGGTNDGEILVDYVLTVGNAGANVVILGGKGGGEINLNDSDTNATLTGYGSGAVLDLRSQNIVGGGTISNLVLSIDKGSAIVSTGSNNTFTLNPGATIYSEGTIGANDSSTLIIENTTIDESAFAKGDEAGIIETISATSHLELYSVHVEGGGIYGFGGAIQAMDGGTIIDGSTSAGAVTILGDVLAAGGATLTFKGMIVNHGDIGIQGGTQLTIDWASGATFTSGGVGMKGTISFDDNLYNSINTNGSATTLTNVDNTISGSVHFYNMTIVNEAGGTIDATGTNYQIIIDGTDVLQNSGLIEATGAAGLYIADLSIDGALGGRIVAGDDSYVDLASDTFKGGVISSVGNGKWVLVDAGNVLDGSTASGAVTVETMFAATGGATLTLKGTIHNEATIAIDGGTQLTIDAISGATLDSGGSSTKGKLTFDDNPYNSVNTNGSATTLTNVDNTISGSVHFYNTTIVNQSGGAIDATGANYQIIIDGTDLLDNSGLIEATGAAGLYIAGQTIDGALGGKIVAGNGSFVDLASDIFKGGVISSVGTGQWALVDAGNVLDGSTSSGAVTVETTFAATGGATLTLKGTIHNEATVAIDGGTQLTIDAASGATLDSGGMKTKGQLTFDDNPYNSVNTNGSGSTLTNVDNTISGAVHFYNTTIVNQSGGTIDATGANYQIIIDGTDLLDNSGLIEATGAAGLHIGGQVIDGALGGRIVAGDGSLVDLASDTFKGGVISSMGTGKWALVDAGNVLDGSTSSGAVTVETTFAATGGATLTLKGAIHNEATIAIDGGTQLTIDATSGATLDSGGSSTKGQLTFDDNPYNSVNTNSSGSTLINVDNTISGSVHFYNMTIVNEIGGTIDATGASYQIIFDGTDVLENSGLIEATGAAGLYIANEVIDGALGGKIVAGNGSLIDLASDTFEGGVISSVGTGKWALVDAGNVLDGSTSSGAVTVETTFVAAGGATLTLKGAIHNEATIAIDGGTQLTIDATSGATLDSGGMKTKGQLTFDDNPYNSVNTNGSGSTLTNVDNTISGSVHFYNTTIVNQSGGTVDATGTNYQIIIDYSDSVANAGLLEATGAAGLYISNTTIKNSGGTIFAGAGSKVELLSDLVTLGTLQTTGSGVIEIADSGSTLSAGKIIDGLTLNATIQVDTGQMLAIAGSVVNAGKIEVGATGSASLNLGATLDGAGSIVMFDSASSQILGGFDNVGNTISGAGTISAAIQQQAGGVIEATDIDNALKLATGVAVQNGGVLEANGGMLIVDDAVTGAGNVVITNGGSASFASSFDENVDFLGSGAGALDLTDAYEGTISGFDASDSIELLGLSADGAFLDASDQIVVMSGTNIVATLQLSGNYGDDGFVAKTNATGVEIVEIAAPTVAQYLANTSYYDGLPNGFAIADSAPDILAHLTQLAADAQILNITSRDGLVTVSVAAFMSGQKALDRIVGGFAIADNATSVTNGLAALAADASRIHAITLTSGTVTVSTTQFDDDGAALDEISGGFGIADAAANIRGDLSALQADAAKISTIATTSGSVSVTVESFLANQAALDKIVGGFTIADTATNFVSGLSAIVADFAHIAAFEISGASIVVTASQAVTYRAVLDKIDGGYAIADTATNIQANLAALVADAANIGSLTSTSGVVTVSDASFQANRALLDEISGGFAVSDSAANIQADLAVLDADPQVVQITVTSGAIDVSLATFASSLATFRDISGGVTVSDTAANVMAGLATLEANVSLLESIVLTSGTVSVSAAQFDSSGAVFAKIAGGFAVVDTAANIQGDLAALQADAGNINSITLTSGAITVTVAVFLANRAALDKIAGGFAISDTGANISDGIATISADMAHIKSVAVTGAVTVSASEAVSSRAELDKLAGGYAISDTAANIQAVLGTLAADTANIVSITSTSGKVTVGDAIFEADRALLNKVAQGILISDAGAAIVADLPGLEAEIGHIAGLVATDGAPAVGIAKFKAFSALLDKFVGGFAIKDIAANIKANLAAILADGAHISAITSTNKPLTVSAATFVADEAMMDKVTGGVAISDAKANIVADAPQLLGDLSHVQSVYFTNAGTPTLKLTDFQLGLVRPVLSKVINNYVLDDITATGVVATGHGNGLTITDVAGNDTITGGGTNENFVFASGLGHATLVDFSAHSSGAAHDTITLSAAEFGSFHHLTVKEATQHGADLWLQGASGDLIVIDDMTTTQLAGAKHDFKFA